MDFALPFILLAILIFAIGLLKASQAKEEGREHE